MIFKLKKNNIQGIIQIVTDIAQKNTSKDTLKNIFVKAINPNKVVVRSTNYEIFFEGSFDASVEAEGEICVNAFHFANIIRESGDEEIHVEKTSNNWLVLKSENSNNRLPGVSSDIFPDFLFEELSDHFYVAWGEWQKALNMVHFAIGENPARKNLMGLSIRDEAENTVRLTTSDAFRMLSITLEVKDKTGGPLELIVPKKSLQEYRKLNIKDDEIVKVSYNDRLFHVESENMKMKTSLIDAKFPDLTKLLFESGMYSIRFNSQKLLSVIRVLKIFVSEMNFAAKLTFEGSKALIESEKNEVGESMHHIDCLYDGEKISIGLNVKFLEEAVSVFGADDIELIFNGTDRPVLISSKSVLNYHNILMPMKIQW